VYCYGGGGGCFDVVHVETNKKETSVKKKHPYPETLEQGALRSGFGSRRILNVILHLRNSSLMSGQTACDGILEWPDYVAGIRWSAHFILMGQYQLQKRRFFMGLKILVGSPALGSLILYQVQ
jgi:hypothetical protein